MSKWPHRKLKLIIMVVVLGFYGAFSWAWIEIHEPLGFYVIDSTSH